MDSKILHQEDVEAVIYERVVKMQIGSALQVRLNNGAVEVPAAPDPKLEVELYPAIVAGDGWETEDTPVYTNGIPIPVPSVFLVSITGEAVYTNEDELGGQMALNLRTTDVGDQLVRTIVQSSALQNQVSPISASGIIFTSDLDDALHVEAITANLTGTWTIQALRLDLVKVSTFGFAWL